MDEKSRPIGRRQSLAKATARQIELLSQAVSLKRMRVENGRKLISRHEEVCLGVIALSGNGHPGSTEPTHLHFGVKLDGEYVDPMRYLDAVDLVDLVHLAPLPAA